MVFYSHAKEENGVKIGSKLLKDHLTGVYLKAEKSAYPKAIPDISYDELQNMILDLTVFHDLGKYTRFFQKYLLGKKVNKNLKNHSVIGAIYLINKYKDKPFLAALLYFLSINHHSNFKNILETRFFHDEIESNNFIESQLADIQKNSKQIASEVVGFDSERFLTFPNKETQKEIRRAIRKKISKCSGFFYYQLPVFITDGSR